MISEAFRTAIWQYRARGGRLYKLAFDRGMSPSVLTATINGARKADDDERVVAIAASLGLTREQVFEREETVAP